MFVILSSLQLLNIVVYFTGTNALQCAYLKLESSSTEELTSLSVVNTENKSTESVEHCTHEHSFCYTLWQYDPYEPLTSTRFNAIGKGCWNHTQDSFCNVIQCISHPKPFRALNNTKFCCCNGNLCNSNFSIDAIDSYSEEEFNLDLNLESVNIFAEITRNSSFLIFVFVFVLFVVTVIIVFTICYKSIYSNSKILNNEKSMDSLHLLESQSLSLPSAPLYSSICSNSLEDLSFIEIIGKGKYGTVWKGKLSNLAVAIKIVSEENKCFLLNECRIYSLPFMTHSCLPRFYGYKEILTQSNYVECCIAIEYGHMGSLYKYLQEHTLDWPRLCKLVKTLVQGLAYLHTEIFKDNKLKPSIAHRDLCSRNIIVKADGTCMICDYQFAIYFINNKAPYFEERGASLVGTLRYLAPEILECAINLCQSESSLKQADIYSLGLILWEMASRCSDLYQGIDVPGYKMPFEQEVGQKPSFDQLKVLVSRHKARPLFPDIWKDSNPAIRLLKETIVECWDQEPEARLTALCIEERVCELPLLWKRYKMETLSKCCVVTSLQQQLKNIQNNLNSNISTTVNNNICKQDVCNHKASVMNDSLESKYSQSNCYINKFENSLHYKYSSHHHLLHHPYHNHLFYQHNLNNAKKQDVNSTLEKNMNASLSAKMNQPKLTLPLQPHQARNLCIERNLMLDTSDEHDGLLEQGLKFQTKSYLKSNTTGSDNLPSETRNSDLNYPENRTLVRPTLPQPISYVQNPVGPVTNETSSNQPIKAKDTNKFKNRHDPGELSSKISLFEYIKQKLNIAYLGKSSRDKTDKLLTAKRNINPLLEEWKENCNDNLDIDAARIGTLLYAKDSQTNGFEFSNRNRNICNNVNLNISTITSANNNNSSNLPSNSSPLISNECDLSLIQNDLLSKDKMIQLTNSSCNQKSTIGQGARINNQIDDLDIFLAGSSKIEHASDDIRVEESQLLHSHTP